jgi:hypothetical protein
MKNVNVLILILAVAIALAKTLARELECTKSIWEDSIDRDLDRYSASGIHRSYLDEGKSLVVGGWGFIIINNTLYYNPYGKSPTHNHAMVVLLARAMCRYSMPDVEFVMHDADRKKKNTGWQTTYVMLSNAKDVMIDQDLLIPYQSFLHYKNHVKSFVHHSKPWAQRIDKAVWRGSSTGGLFTPKTWRFKPRTKMMLTLQEQNDSKCCDMGFVNVHVQAFKEAAADMTHHLEIKERITMDDMTR